MGIRARVSAAAGAGAVALALLVAPASLVGATRARPAQAMAPVTGLTIDGATITIDNPCRDQTSMPPFDPEITAFLRTSSATTDDDFQIDSTSAIPTGTARASFLVPAAVPSGSYLLEVVCLAHRDPAPRLTVASPIDWVAPVATATSTTTTSTPATASPSPPDAPAAPAVSGSASYTG